MELHEINDTEAFFKLVSIGSVTELKKLLSKFEQEVVEKISKSCNIDGETPLLLAIKGNHKKMVKFLLQNLNVPIAQTGRFVWRELVYGAVPPLLAAILSDQTSDLCIIDFLITKEVRIFTSSVNVDSVLSSPIPCSQKIEILELMGAAYILIQQGKQRACQFGLQCWTEAIALRQSTGDDCGPMPKFPFNLSDRAQNVFGNTVEFTTLEKLHEIGAQLNGNDLPEIQALLVIQRIMSQIHPDPHPFLIQNFLHFGEDIRFRSQGQYLVRVVNISMLILELFEVRLWEEAISFEWPFRVIIDTLSLMEGCISDMRQNPPSNSEQEFLVCNFIIAVSYASAYAAKLPQESGLDTKIDIMASSIYRIVISLANIELEFNLHTRTNFKKCLVDYVRFMNRRNSVSNILHMACSCLNKIPIQLIQLFLEAGANPNATDELGHTALHILAFYSFSRNRISVAYMLFEAGAHLDQPNTNGETPLELFRRMQRTQEGRTDPIWHSLVNTVLPLTCYCAQVIHKYQVPFKTRQLPTSLESFIQSHGVKD